MKAKRISKLIENQIVLCDDCGWQIETTTLKSVRDWHNKKCPECNDCVIINDEELAIFEKANENLLEAERLMEAGGINIEEMSQDLATLVKELNPGEEILKATMICASGREGKEDGITITTETTNDE